MPIKPIQSLETLKIWEIAPEIQCDFFIQLLVRDWRLHHILGWELDGKVVVCQP